MFARLGGYNATVFNQDIGTWDVSNGLTFVSAMVFILNYSF